MSKIEIEIVSNDSGVPIDVQVERTSKKTLTVSLAHHPNYTKLNPDVVFLIHIPDKESDND